jgi:hypothetical protein
MEKMVLVGNQFVLQADASETRWQKFIKNREFTNKESKNKVKFGSLPKKQQQDIRKDWNKSNTENDGKGKKAKENDANKPTTYVPESVLDFSEKIKQQFNLGEIPEGSILDFTKETPEKNPEFFTNTKDYQKRKYSIKVKSSGKPVYKTVGFSKLSPKQQKEIKSGYKNTKLPPERLAQPIPKVGKTYGKNKKTGKKVLTREILNIIYNPGYNPNYPESGPYCVYRVNAMRKNGKMRI